MKKLILAILLTVFFATTAFAAGPELQWEVASGNPDGFILSHKELTATSYIETTITSGTVREYQLDQLGLTPGVRYEFYLRATLGGSESAPSDIIRYTMPMPQQIIEIPPETQQVIINIGVVP
jgi:hypothetical protein